ncbi:protein trichome birefringence-like 2 [Vicia villosa]|uniref:protein trichome birefringence-like 2 n=1 Tax=Vicia villosa TaxID=3911 RepID=UPI00273B7423|nr:protein trichome birefringence-like 2 [Vicia villosa]
MECSKRITISEHFLSHRTKILSGFTLGLLASLVFLTLLFFNSSFKIPKLQAFLQGSQFNRNSSSSSSFSSWHFPFSTFSSNSDSNHSVTPLHTFHEEQQSLAREVNVSNQGSEKGKTNSGNFTDNLLDRGRVDNDKVGNFSVGKTNSSANLLDRNGDAKVGNFSVGKGNSSVAVAVEKSVERIDEKCDIFDGNWVRDESKPYYPLGSCPFVDRDFDCHLNGRPDSDYVKWKWKPSKCDIPSLNATDFLEKLRGQRLVFVGDSLNRNMWESMVCILRQSISDKKRVHEISGKRRFKKKGVYSFRFEDYNCSVDFVSSTFIVRESTFQGVNGTIETLRLDLMDEKTIRYHDAEIIVFNTGHWWTHEKTSKGEDYYQEGNHVYPRLKVLDAYKRALTTWARWIDNNVDPNRTHVFFRGYSVTHFSGGQWNSGGKCHKETEPINKGHHLRKYPSKMRVLDYIIPKMKTPVIYMNISRMTDYRKDAHPSIYRMEYKSEAEWATAEEHQDCSHWCLPGVPDTWNELLYASLLQYGKGNWKT